jgi:phage I-like protein
VSILPQIAFELGDLAAGLVRIPLMKIGRFRKGTQVIPLTRQLMSEVVANFRKRKARGLDETAGDVVVDYEHASESPDIAMGGPVPAAGWLREIEDGPDSNGILWGLIELTGKARAAVKARELRYTSPFIQGTLDKVTGEPQGATLTSVALTNKPFQDWLPAISLSDGWREEIDRTDLTDQGGRVKKLILADRVARIVRVIADDNTETLVALEGLEDLPSVLRLSDVKLDSKGRYDFLALALTEGCLVAGEVFAAQQAQQALETAITDGRVLPEQRAIFERMALSDATGFQTLVNSMKPQLAQSTRGMGGNEGNVNNMNFGTVSGYLDQDWNPIQLEINRRIQQKMATDKRLSWNEAYQLVMDADPKLAIGIWDALQVEMNRRVKQMMAGNSALDYGRAQEAVWRADPALYRDYQAAMKGNPNPGVRPVNEQLQQQVDTEIEPLVQAKIGLSEGGMDYGQAWIAVLNERPDLRRRRMATM